MAFETWCQAIMHAILVTLEKYKTQPFEYLMVASYIIRLKLLALGLLLPGTLTCYLFVYICHTISCDMAIWYPPVIFIGAYCVTDVDKRITCQSVGQDDSI